MKTIFGLLLFSIGTSVLAASPATFYKEEFGCMNPNQKENLLISIDSDQNGTRYLHAQSESVSLEVLLSRSGQVGLFDNSTFEANGITVVEIAGIEDPPKRANVRIKGQGNVDLIFMCTPTDQKTYSPEK